MLNKRVHKRVPFEVKVHFDTAVEQIRSHRLLDISMTGCFFETDTPLPQGTLGTIKLYLDSGEQHIVISANGKVIRSLATDIHSKGGLGIEFTEIDTESSIHLFNVIKYQADTEHPES